MKKGLAIVYDPHNLYQFVWYYCQNDVNKEWDALCLPNGYKGEYIHTYCEAAGIFSKIYRDDKDFSSSSKKTMVKEGLSMFTHFITGRRKKYCEKLLSRYVPLDDYDEISIIAEVGVVSGASCSLAKDKKVVILEDGLGDYSIRPRFNSKDKTNFTFSWSGLILSQMGYCSPGWFNLRTNKDCIKYSSQPDKMLYRGYKEIRQLYSMDNTDFNLFNSIVEKMYPSIKQYNFDNIDAVFLTRPLDDYVNASDKYKQRIEKIMSEYSNVLIKKHPREHDEYNVVGNVILTELDSSIPAEAILSYIKGKHIFVVSTSAIIINVAAFDLDCTVLILDGMYEESISTNSKFTPATYNEADIFCKKFAGNHCNIRLI